MPSDSESAPRGEPGVARPVIHLIEDDPAVREAERYFFEGAGWDVCDYVSAEEFLAGPRPCGEYCLVIDVILPGMSGLALLEQLRAENAQVPAIMLTGRGDAAAAVAALKAGATDYIEKPANRTILLESVSEAIARSREVRAREVSRTEARIRFGKLTPREQTVMAMVLEGMPNKNIAADLGVSQRTIESHRSQVMRKSGARSLPELVLLYLAANSTD